MANSRLAIGGRLPVILFRASTAARTYWRSMSGEWSGATRARAAMAAVHRNAPDVGGETRADPGDLPANDVHVVVQKRQANDPCRGLAAGPARSAGLGLSVLNGHEALLVRVPAGPEGFNCATGSSMFGVL